MHAHTQIQEARSREEGGGGKDWQEGWQGERDSGFRNSLVSTVTYFTRHNS